MRQGDVSLHSYIPNNNLQPIKGDVVLALGETSGHQHVLLPLNKTTKTWIKPSEKIKEAYILDKEANIAEAEYVQQLKIAQDRFKFFTDDNGSKVVHITEPAMFVHLKIENGLLCPADHEVITVKKPAYKRIHQETEFNPFLKSIEKSLD